MSALDSLADILPAESASEGAQRPTVPGRQPESVVRPGCTEEVAAVMAWAHREGVGVLPVSSGRRVSPVRGSRPYVAISTERLSSIDIYEPADLTLTAGAGTPFGVIDAALRAHRQWGPFDPPFVEERSLGGLVARGESGPLWMGYGELRNHVLGATLVTGDGRTLRLGGRVVKNVAGYDVLKAVVGSRGALGVITSVCIRAFPLPLVDRVLVLRGPQLSELAALARRVGTAPVLPVSCVLIDQVGRLGEPPSSPHAETAPDTHPAGVAAPIPSTASREGRDAAALVVRLHGAAATVDADQSTLEAHLGVRFQVTDGRGGLALEAMRDRGADAAVVLSATALPSRLGDLLTALGPLEPIGIVVDSYAARARVALDTFRAEEIGRARSMVEGLGGALAVERAPAEVVAAERSSGPSVDEADLASALRAVFDPGGVLWPVRS